MLIGLKHMETETKGSSNLQRWKSQYHLARKEKIKTPTGWNYWILVLTIELVALIGAISQLSMFNTKYESGLSMFSIQENRNCLFFLYGKWKEIELLIGREVTYALQDRLNTSRLLCLPEQKSEDNALENFLQGIQNIFLQSCFLRLVGISDGIPKLSCRI